MDAVDLLEQQHKEVEQLFQQLGRTEDEREQRELFFQIADQLVLHSTIEERHFYPAVRRVATEKAVEESLDQHEVLKSMIAEMLDVDDVDEEFLSDCLALEQETMAHVAEERRVLLPAARELLSDGEREAIGEQMTATMASIEEEQPEPRKLVLREIEPGQPNA